ncbi:uncharacterized protein VP01_2469g2 [Puccinia sorghi]|uniref:Uncharacterized protein n=1 Tax=Puccinia sorghi TaxID=27349 RepID=A0A0L6V624_9BASI|nr:uncharacterized protein VP01_2469g2 [Puccinia sorghi]
MGKCFAWDNSFACMILHNLLNRRGTLYHQKGDNRLACEGRYQELPNTHADPQDEQLQSPSTQMVSMNIKRDIILDDLYKPSQM